MNSVQQEVSIELHSALAQPVIFTVEYESVNKVLEERPIDYSYEQPEDGAEKIYLTQIGVVSNEGSPSDWDCVPWSLCEKLKEGMIKQDYISHRVNEMLWLLDEAHILITGNLCSPKLF